MSKRLSSPQQLAKKRILSNFESGVRAPAAAYATSHKLRLIVHSDAALPPLRQQLDRFARARVIVAPLGAGTVNVLASTAGACLVELQEDQWQPDAIVRHWAALNEQPQRSSPHASSSVPHSDATYERLAAMLGLQYVRVRTHNWVADPKAVSTGLAQCATSRTNA